MKIIKAEGRNSMLMRSALRNHAAKQLSLFIRLKIKNLDYLMLRDVYLIEKAGYCFGNV